jgi:CheY-like chemotaxis protein
MPTVDIHGAQTGTQEHVTLSNALHPGVLAEPGSQDEEKRRIILLVEDDRGDQLLTQEALGESVKARKVLVVSDGEEALRYLRQSGEYSDPLRAPRPDLILLDLNMPKVNGRQVAEQVKADPDLKLIPVVVLSTSNHPDDVRYCYRAGVNAYVHKPTNFDDFVEAVQAIEQFWLRIVESPKPS